MVALRGCHDDYRNTLDHRYAMDKRVLKMSIIDIHSMQMPFVAPLKRQTPEQS